MAFNFFLLLSILKGEKAKIKAFNQDGNEMEYES